MAWVSLVVVYVAWGSTYVAIRVAVREIPPFTLAAIRYLIAGARLWPIAIRSGGALRATDRPGARQWAAGALIGVLLLVGGNGGVTVGEQHVQAGLAALLIATVPLWMAVDGRLLFRAPIGSTVAVGLLVGIGGVAVLVRPAAHSGRTGMLICLVAAALWGLGSVAAPHLPLPQRPLVSSAIETLTGGAVLLMIGAVSGEFGRLHAVSAETLWAMVFLVFGGSLLGFTAYAHVLARLPAPVVSTYAYVNPLVAVLLGWALLGEQLSGADAIGAALIVAAVVAVVASRSGGFGRRVRTARSAR